MDEIEAIRRAYFLQGKSIRAIARARGHGRPVVRRAIASAEPGQYRMGAPRAAPVLGPYRERIDELLTENKTMPRKQRYTAHKIFEQLQVEGYTGSESGVRIYVAARRQELRVAPTFMPLEFDPGQDAQMDWGEAEVDMNGQRITVQVFVLRLNYSRAKFVMAFPFQKQEAFLEGHVQAFRFCGGVPHRITYDNLKTAVYRILRGRQRQEQERFIGFRSHYLFESYYCTPGMGHQKGGVENDVGFSRRNFLVPIPQVASYHELNAHLYQKCLDEMKRQVERQPTTIGEAFVREQAHLLPLPARDYLCCLSRPVRADAYSLVSFETNRYSVPTEYAGRPLVLRAFPFQVEVLFLDQVIARHARCLATKQDVLDPLHYLSLLAKRPGAFDHAKPIRQWRAQWPAVYESLLAHLRETWPEGRGVREFVRILALVQEHPHSLVEKAVAEALQLGCVHYDGVLLCLRQLQQPDTPVAPLDLTHFPQLAAVGHQPVNLACYDQLLGGGSL